MYGSNVELQEELSPADAVLLMSSVPERIADLVYGLDEGRLGYRHGPAFPTLGGLIGHLVDSGTKVDGLLRHGHPPRDGPHRPDSQLDRPGSRTQGPRPARAAGCDSMTDEEPTAEGTAAA